MRRTLFLASEVRSGSTFVAESIAYQLDKSFGYAFWGLAKEHFAKIDHRSTLRDVLGIYDSLYLDKSGWASSKVMCKALSVIHREARTSHLVHEAFFGKDAHWIIVRRKDRIRQAISLALARKSKVYHYYGESDDSPDTACNLEHAEIEDALRAILLSDAYLDVFSASLPKERSVSFYYEDFLDGNIPYLNQVYRLCGFDLVPDAHKYENSAKIRPTATGLKKKAFDDYVQWFLENYH